MKKRMSRMELTRLTFFALIGVGLIVLGLTAIYSANLTVLRPLGGEKNLMTVAVTTGIRSTGTQTAGPAPKVREATAETVWIANKSAGNFHGKVSCKALINGSKAEQEKATDFMRGHIRLPITPDDYIQWTRDCEDFRSRRKYVMKALPEEVDFPLAYSLLMYKDAEQAERLLRAVYRPHNFVCVHVDAKAEAKVKDAMAAIASCLPGVFVHQRPLHVVWGKFSVLEADLICMRALLSHPKWRYFINLTGQEFPLKTNLQLVKVLQAYSGANDVEGVIHG